MKITDSQGNIKWAPEDFGDYDIEKIEAIAKILSDITLTFKEDSSSGSSNFYTKSETEERILDNLRGYLRATDLSNTVSSLVDGRVSELMSDKGNYDISSLRNYTLQMYKLLYGYDFQGTPDPNIISYATKFMNLESITGSHTTTIGQLSNIVFKSSSSYVRNVALRDDLGEIINLKTSNKSNLVNAVNEIFDNYSNFIYSSSESIGDLLDLKTSNSINLVGAINEVLLKCNSISSDIADDIGDLSNLKTTDSTNMVGAVNEVLSKCNLISSDVNSIVGDLSNLKTSDRSNIISAINEVFISCSDFKKSIADAITAMGVHTNASDSKEVMVDNIKKISSDITVEFYDYSATEVEAESEAYVTITKLTSTGKTKVLNINNIKCYCNRCGNIDTEAIYKVSVDGGNLEDSGNKKSYKYSSSIELQGKIANKIHTCNDEDSGTYMFCWEGDNITLS